MNKINFVDTPEAARPEDDSNGFKELSASLYDLVDAIDEYHIQQSKMTSAYVAQYELLNKEIRSLTYVCFGIVALLFIFIVFAG